MKICSKCGSSLENDEKFCNVCGSNQLEEDAADVVKGNGKLRKNIISSKSPKKKRKTSLFIGIAGVVFVAVGIFLLFNFGIIGNNNPKGIVNKYMEAIEELDFITMIDCMAYSKEYKEEIKNTKNEVKAELKAMEEASTDIEIDYEVVKIRKASSKEKKEFWNDSEDLGVMVKKSDVKGLRICEIKLKISGFEQNEESDMILYIGKYKGDWKILSTED